jgi:hypothetical protein
MLIPVVTAIVLLVFFGRKTVWWEFALPFLVSIILIQTSKMIAVSVATMDREYWGSNAISAAYYEAWDERVSCRHPVYCYRPATRTDSEGHIEVTIERYRCGWEHGFDVDYHSPKWEIRDNLGAVFPASKELFEALAIRWHNRTFANMGRKYHSIDGDKYEAKWDRKDETIEPFVTMHSYVNRVKPSKEFDFKEVTPEEKTQLGLYDYPVISTYCPSILGRGPNDETANRYLDIWNAKLGPQKQVRMWVLVFQDKPKQAGIMQESYWKGGNKNEVVVCIGTDKEWNITWCKAFSWTKNTGMLTALKDRIAGPESVPLDLDKVALITVEEVSKGFVRREFKEFDTLKVEPGKVALAVTFVLTFLVNLGVSFYVVENEFENKANEPTKTKIWKMGVWR